LDKTRRLAQMVMERHPGAFSEDYEKNKEALNEIAVIPSKQLRNHIAGYIAKEMKAEKPEVIEETGESKAE
jgi:small subunit ribosomal protein S17e